MPIKSSTALFFIILTSVTFQTIGNSTLGNEYLIVMLLGYFVLFKRPLNVAIVITVIFFTVSAVYSYIIEANLTKAILFDFTTILKPYLVGLLCASLPIILRDKQRTILLYLFTLFMIYNWIIYFLGLSVWHYGRNWELAGSTVQLFLFSLLFLNNKKHLIYVLLLFLLSVGFIASGQGKHMAFFAIAVAVVLYFEKFHSLLLNKDVSKVYFYTIFVVLLSSVTFYSVIEVARDDVKTYYLQDNSKDSSTARRAFLNNLPDVLEGKYIFLGRGLASYGSPASGRYYSSLYYDLGMNRVHGMSKDRPMFVNDAYYAMFFGQLGIAGLIFQVFFWCYMLSPFWICFRSKANIPKTYMIVSVLSVAWSFIFIAGSGLFNSQGSFIMCALGLARGHLKVMLKNENRASVFNQQSVQYRTIA